MADFIGTGLDYATPLTINSRERIVRSETLNLKTQTVSNDSQRWDMVVTLEPTTSEASTTAAAQLASHRARHGLHTSFDMEMPQYPGVASLANLTAEATIANWDSTATYDAHELVSYAEGGDSMVYLSLVGSNLNNTPSSSTDSWTVVSANAIGDNYVSIAAGSGSPVNVPDGYFFRFSGNTKVYMANLGSTIGTRTGAVYGLKVFPPLVATVGDGATVDMTPDINVYYAADGVEGITVTDGIVTRATIQVVENLE